MSCFHVELHRNQDNLVIIVTDNELGDCDPITKRVKRALRDGVTRGWRKLHNEELHNLYSLPSIIRIIKSRRMRWAGHVAQMGEKRTCVGYW
jgi:hypothetical protein